MGTRDWRFNRADAGKAAAEWKHLPPPADHNLASNNDL